MIMIDLNYTVDLARPVEPKTLTGPLYYGDEQAHRVNVKVLRNGVAVDLTGVTCYGYLVWEELNETFELEPEYCSVSASDGTASVILPKEAYLHTGRCYLIVQLEEGDSLVTVLALYGQIVHGITGIIVIPETSHLDIHEIEEMLTEIRTATENANAAKQSADAAAEAARTAALTAVTYAAQSGKADADKAQARTNIGAAARDDSFLAPMDASVMKYLATDLHGTKTFVSGNHYVYNYDGAATTNTYVTNLVGTAIGLTKTTLTNWQPPLEQLMPVDVFGKAIRFEYFCNSRGQSITRNPRLCYKFATVENGSITEYLSFGNMFDGVLDTQAEASITVPAGATHVALGIYYSGYNANTVYDVVYSFRSAEGMSLPDAIGPVEDGLASRNYAVGELLMRRGKLYRVTQAIVAGDAISTSTNIAETNVLEHLADRVKLTEQTLTDAQKMQVRTNIGAVDENVLAAAFAPVEYWDADSTAALSGRRVKRENGYEYTVTGTGDGGVATGHVYHRLSGVLGVISTSNGANGWTSSVELESGVPYTMTVIPLSGSIGGSGDFFLQLRDENNVQRARINLDGTMQTTRFYWPDSTLKGKLILRTVMTVVTNDFRFRLILARDMNAIPQAPATDGTYTLKVTVTDGTPAYSWVSE